MIKFSYFILILFFFNGMRSQDQVVSSSGKIISVNNAATSIQRGVVKLTGELSGTADSPTLTNSGVINKVLTGFSPVSGVVTASDSIVKAFSKLQGQINNLVINGNSGTWSIPPNSTQTFTISLPESNRKYEFSANGVISNGILAYSGTFVTTNTNTPRFLKRNLYRYYSGNNLKLFRDPLEYSTFVNDNRVKDAIINNASFAAYPYDDLNITFQIQNLHSTETATVFWKYTY